MNKISFMFGLPACGKSTYIENELLPKNPNSKIISADSFKENFWRKDKENCHQKSIELAERNFYKLLEAGKDIIFDGGGINNHYNIRLAKEAQKHLYHIDLYVFDTPAEVCLKRNNKRSRVVPVPDSAIIQKAVVFDKCLANLSPYIDNIHYIKYFTNRSIFVDMDGTVSTYRHIPLDEYGCIDFMNGEYFRFSKPVSPIINKLKSYYTYGSEIKILSACPDNFCQAQKIEWLQKYMPFIDKDNMCFIGNKAYKHVMLRNMIKKYKLNPKDVTMIDDDHRVLGELAKIGINAIHTSMFLSGDY